MALTATVYTIDIDLADSDRGVYETLALRVARHPSESEEYLLTRVLAYALDAATCKPVCHIAALGGKVTPGTTTPPLPLVALGDSAGWGSGTLGGAAVAVSAGEAARGEAADRRLGEPDATGERAQPDRLMKGDCLKDGEGRRDALQRL